MKITKPLLAIICTVGAFAAGSNPDMSFAKDAAQGGMAEVKLGQMAASQAQNPKVKAFGQKMVDDHSKAGNELSSIAQRKNVTLPADVSSKDKATMDRLSALSGDAFDKAYMSDMVKDHQTDVADFQREANSGKDDDFKGFAAKTLPTLQEHLRMAKDAANAVGAPDR
jgi:putative membrane protein